MTANRRIFLNIIATYGRSLYAIVLGLFAGRWTLNALGTVDYGLYGLIGGMVVFVVFLSWSLNAAIERYFGIAVGKMQADPEGGILDGQKWFTVGVVVFSVIPIFLYSVGYPIGVWFIRHFLTIPADRIEPCIWVWRFVCLSSLFGLITVPFTAIYTARQKIAELTVYSFITATLLFVFQYYMITHPGDWLRRLALYSCALSIAPQVIISIRAIWLFPECKLNFSVIEGWKSFKEILSYSAWYLFSSVMSIARGQGIAILVNKYFGPSVNAAYQVGNTVSGHAGSLSASMTGAFAPAILNAYGAEDKTLAITLAQRANKFGALLFLLFAIPLAVEIDEVFILWLKNPPPYSAGICLIVLATVIVDRLTSGCATLISATGRIARFQTANGVIIALAFPLAWSFILLGLGVYGVPLSILVTSMLLGIATVYYAKITAKFSFSAFIKQVLLPVFIIVFCCIAIGYVPHLFIQRSFCRLLASCGVTITSFVALTWFLALSNEDRLFVITRFNKKLTLKWHSCSLMKSIN